MNFKEKIKTIKEAIKTQNLIVIDTTRVDFKEDRFHWLSGEKVEFYIVKGFLVVKVRYIDNKGSNWQSTKHYSEKGFYSNHENLYKNDFIKYVNLLYNVIKREGVSNYYDFSGWQE